MKKEVIENKIEITKNSVNDTGNKKISSRYSNSIKNRNNLKERLEELIGTTDFSAKLNEVNLVIGIIVSAILLAYFIS